MFSLQAREMIDNTTTVTAAGMVSSPVWLPWLKAASEVAAVIAPILGVIWLVVQIWAKITLTVQKKDSNE